MDQRLPDQQTLLRAVALTPTGERLGLIAGVHHAPDSTQPQWAWVRTGTEVTDLSLVPLTDARYGHGSLVVPTTAAAVQEAPRHAAGTSLSPAQESELREHYALNVQPIDDHPAQTTVAASDASPAEQKRPPSTNLGSTIAPRPVPTQVPSQVPSQVTSTQGARFETEPAPGPRGPRTDTAGTTPRKDVVVEVMETVLHQLNTLLKRVRR